MSVASTFKLVLLLAAIGVGWFILSKVKKKLEDWHVL
jgi:hypothetical protein